jgi:electron transfer flavoprotein alpha subunit
LLGQTLSGRDLASRLAFRLETGLVTDCTALRLEDGQLVMTKPVYGGNALAEYVGPRPQIATIRPRAFDPAEPDPARKAELVRLEVEGAESQARVVDTVKEPAAAGPQLKDAKVVVSGGRGLGGPENWHFIEELAETLGGAVGATRAVTDAGWVPPSLQVGLTGVTITPDLYITVAISGAVQHIAGCSGARNVIAINKDAEANIFKHARYGVVGDWKQILPAFTAKLKELRGG